MKLIKKTIIYGLFVWLIPFIISFAFYSPDGGLIIDKIFFKTILIVVGTAVGAIFMIKYFAIVKKDFLKEGLILGLIWLAINWGLDLAILVPMAKMTFLNYFAEIGLRYIVMLILSVTIGYLLKLKNTENGENRL